VYPTVTGLPPNATFEGTLTFSDGTQYGPG
jgi:hypothetical protein